MSGSYDKPTGRRDPSASQTATNFDLYDTVLTGPSGPNQHYAYESPTIATHDDPPPVRKFAPSRARKTKNEQSSTPVVPPDTVTGRSLTLVISIMCFLACLTAGAVYMMNQSASAWLRDIASEVTVQVEVRDRPDVEKLVTDVSSFLSRQPGIANVRPLSMADAAQLLEPWLGQTEALKTLPVPRLIALELDRQTAPDLDAIRSQMVQQFKGVTLDDHRRWQQQIRTITRSFALGGLAILLLVGAATTAIIVSATKSAMA